MKAAAKKKTKAKPKAISQAAPASSVPLRLEWLDPAELAILEATGQTFEETARERCVA